MRGWLEPVGDASANTYWIRRGVVAAVLVALVIAAIWGVGRLVGGPAPTTGTPQNPAGAQTPTDTDPAGTESQTAPQPGPSGATDAQTTDPASAETASAAAPPATETAPPNCRISALSAGLEGANPLPVGEAAVFRVSIATSQASCLLDLATGPAQLTITSGTDQIWTTTSCPEWQPAGQFTLTPEQPAVFEIGWPNRRGDGCGLVETQLGAGTYVASFALGQAAARYVFQIS